MFEKVFNWFLGLTVLSLILGLILVFVTDFQITNGHYVLEVREEYELVAFANSSQLSGGFFLLAGSFQTDPIYHVMRQNADGGVWQSTISAGPNTIIYETSDCTPHITVSYKRSTKWPYWARRNECELVYQVYIPEGSIWSGYDVDIREN